MNRHFALLAGLALMLGACAGLQGPTSVEGPPTHPLDPLCAGEIDLARRLVLADARCPERVAFEALVLDEPAKALTAAWEPGQPIPRRALAVLLDRRAARTCAVIVDLAAGAVASWREVPGVQPAVLDEEYELAEQIVRADPRFAAAMGRRGISVDRVEVDGWAPGEAVAPEAAGARLLCTLVYAEGGQTFYARPIEGTWAVVDLTHERVLKFIDGPVTPVPPEQAPRAAAPPARRERTAPGAAHVALDGHAVSWRGWRFRWSLHPREGLVIHAAGFQQAAREGEDAPAVRPVVHRASVAEMVVPYGDPDPDWAWRAAFDTGEYRLGRCASELVPGGDLPAGALLLDVVLADDGGEPALHERAVGLYERDGGLLFRHGDEARRAVVQLRSALAPGSHRTPPLRERPVG